MDDPLHTYLSDHLAGSTHLIELLRSIRRTHRGAPIAQFAASLLVQIEADREALRDVAKRAGFKEPVLRRLAGWVSEKFSRVKLRHENPNGVGMFEALEWVQLGIHGKWALWRALAVVAASDPRLRGTDYEHLRQRAEAQEARVDERRLELARKALTDRREAPVARRPGIAHASR